MGKKWSGLMLIMMIAVLLLSACTGDKAAEPPKDPPPAAESTDKGSDQAEPDKTEPEKTEPGTSQDDANSGYFPATDKSLNPALALGRKDTLIIGTTAPKGIFSPLFWSTVYDKYVVEVVFDSFLVVQSDGTYAEHLADKIDVSDDGLKYTFHLKPGIKYSDGTPVTVKDYLFALKVLHDPTYDGESDILSLKIKGGQEYHDGKSPDISGVKIIDDNTVEVEVLEVNAQTKNELGTVEFLPEAYYGKGYKLGQLDSVKALNDKPIGSGQYIVTKYTPGQEVVLEANPNYFKGAPKIKNVILKATTDDTRIAMLQSGEIDVDEVTVNEDNVEELTGLGFLDVNIFPTNGYGYVAFNHNDPKYQDVKVRQALTIGLNRKEVVEGAFGKYANVINIPESNVGWAYTNEGIEPYEFDIDKAKKLLDEAGWVEGSDGIREKDGQKFKINFSATADSSVVEALLPIMTKNYKELGIDFNAETLDFNAISEKRKTGDFEMFFAAWGLTPDPDSTVYITNGAQNNIGYSNKTVDELMLKGKKTLDLEGRKEIYKQVFQELNRDLPVIFMYQRRDMWGINARVTGLDITPYKHFTFSLYQAEIVQ
ncbi:Oligopeptide-binding protein AppA [Paenibacillus sp. CECT 9249]|nr:Oligopeptide-binding protein AppA [Paenibacillus sp. CECT 9249]